MLPIIGPRYDKQKNIRCCGGVLYTQFPRKVLYVFDKLAQWHFFFALFYFNGDAPQKMTSCLFCGMAMDSFYVSIISLSLNYITSIYYDYDRLLPK